MPSHNMAIPNYNTSNANNVLLFSTVTKQKKTYFSEESHAILWIYQISEKALIFI